MTTSTVTAEVHESLDIHRDFSPSVTLNHKVVLDNSPDAIDIVNAQVIAIHLIGQIGFV